MDLLEEDALWKELSRFRRSDELHSHHSQALHYTAGVKCLAARCGLSWLIDIVAMLQRRALQSDPDLAVFQLWVLRCVGAEHVISCLRDSETLIVQIVIPARPVMAPDYLELYVEFGVLMLPGEKSKAPR
ncbi:MAG: DUF6876 family protein [bacterium]